MDIKRYVILALLIMLPLPLFALDPPPLAGRINDSAGMFSPQTRSGLEQKLASFERSTSNQIAVLTIASLQGDDIDQFAIKVAEQWKLGQTGKDNGVLLVLAQAERKVRIEVGMGLQGVLPDVTASRIIREVMRPHLKSGNFDQGINAGVDAIMAATRGEFKASPQDAAKRTTKGRSSGFPTSFIVLLVAVAVAAGAAGFLSRPLAGVAGAAGLPLAAAFSFSGMGIVMLGILAIVGLVAGLLISMLISGMLSGGGGGGYWGGGGGYWGGGYGGGSSGGGGDSFSGGGGDFDGGGSSDDY